MKKRSQLKKSNGFTLLELIIVIIIIGVLVALALPRMSRMVERARVVEAVAIIGTIRAAVERCFLMRGIYSQECSADDVGFPDGWDILGIPDPAQSPGSHFKQYSVFAEGTGYFICARRDQNVNASEGGYALCMSEGVIINVSQNGASISFSYPGDRKIRWASKPEIQAFLPRSD